MVINSLNHSKCAMCFISFKISQNGITSTESITQSINCLKLNTVIPKTYPAGVKSRNITINSANTAEKFMKRFEKMRPFKTDPADLLL